MRKQLFVRHELFLTGGEILHFHLWPFVAEQNRARGAELFGGLKLFADLGRRERVVHAVTPIAECLDLRESVAATLFLRDHDIEVEPLLAGDRLFHPRPRGRVPANKLTQDDIAHGKAKRGERDRVVAQLRHQVVVAAAAGDRPELTAAVERLENHTGVIGESADDAQIHFREWSEPALRETTHQLVELLARSAAIQDFNNWRRQIAQPRRRLLARLAFALVDDLQNFLPALFRDILREDPGYTERYWRLKTALASRFRNDRAAYTDGKTNFIRETLASRKR